MSVTFQYLEPCSSIWENVFDHWKSSKCETIDRKEKTVLTKDVYILHCELLNGCLGSRPILPHQVCICQVCHLECPFTLRCIDALGPTTIILSAILVPALIDQITTSPESLPTYPSDLSKSMLISSPSLVTSTSLSSISSPLSTSSQFPSSNTAASSVWVGCEDCTSSRVCLLELERPSPDGH